MSKQYDGGPAFPVHSSPQYENRDGMSLYDWYVGQALAGLASGIGREDVKYLADGTKGGSIEAKAAHALARAAIEARPK